MSRTRTVLPSTQGSTSSAPNQHGASPKRPTDRHAQEAPELAENDLRSHAEIDAAEQSFGVGHRSTHGSPSRTAMTNSAAGANTRPQVVTPVEKSPRHREGSL